MSNTGVIPTHVGFIMDGNGRWAKQRNMPRNYGHQKGAENVDNVVTACFNRGIKYITLYAFSSENWQRPKEEVDKLMDLFSKFLKKFLKKLLKNEIRLIVTGERKGLSESLIEQIDDAELKTKEFDKVLNLAINYGGKQEIVSAVNKLIKSGISTVTEEDIQNNLYAPFVPPIDLVVRTSGEQRISNFYLWQSAYAELYFADVHWPDFNEEQIDKALSWYASRNRRFGKI